MKQQQLEKELSEVDLCLANAERALTDLLNLTWKRKSKTRGDRRSVNRDQELTSPYGDNNPPVK